MMTRRPIDRLCIEMDETVQRGRISAPKLGALSPELMKFLTDALHKKLEREKAKRSASEQAQDSVEELAWLLGKEREALKRTR